MDDEIKVSELPLATQVNDDDLLMIIQGQANKKIPFQVFNSGVDTRLTTVEGKVAALEEKNIMTIKKNENQSITQNTNPQQITFDNSIKVGTKLTFSNNSIKIGQGVSNILVSACCWANAISGYKWISLRRKRGSNYIIFSQAISPLNTSETWDSVTLTPTLIDVEENDEISLWIAVTGNGAGSVDAGTYESSTYITVEVVE